MKTVKQIDNWFASECDEVLASIPEKVIEMAKNSKEHLNTIAEIIAFRKCFRTNAVLAYLKTKLI